MATLCYILGSVYYTVARLVLIAEQCEKRKAQQAAEGRPSFLQSVLPNSNQIISHDILFVEYFWKCSSFVDEEFRENDRRSSHLFFVRQWAREHRV